MPNEFTQLRKKRQKWKCSAHQTTSIKRLGENSVVWRFTNWSQERRTKKKIVCLKILCLFTTITSSLALWSSERALSRPFAINIHQPRSEYYLHNILSSTRTLFSIYICTYRLKLFVFNFLSFIRLSKIINWDHHFQCNNILFIFLIFICFKKQKCKINFEAEPKKPNIDIKFAFTVLYFDKTNG
jgi:hypothetical protein